MLILIFGYYVEIIKQKSIQILCSIKTNICGTFEMSKAKTSFSKIDKCKNALPRCGWDKESAKVLKTCLSSRWFNFLAVN